VRLFFFSTKVSKSIDQKGVKREERVKCSADHSLDYSGDSSWSSVAKAGWVIRTENVYGRLNPKAHTTFLYSRRSDEKTIDHFTESKARVRIVGLVPWTSLIPERFSRMT
jgi:hypothetical protein